MLRDAVVEYQFLITVMCVGKARNWPKLVTETVVKFLK